MMRSTYAEVNTANLRHNVNSIKKYVNGSEIMAIVKANAYGHGIVEVSKVLASEGVKFFAVAFPDEAVQLREAGIKDDILVLVPGNSQEYSLYCDYNLHAIASSRKYMRKLSAEAVAKGVRVKAHLNIDTGMNRDGVLLENVVPFMEEFSQLPNIDMVGVCTHFATSASDLDFAWLQLSRFQDMLGKLIALGYKFDYIHAANSGAIINMPESHFTHVRPGISLYGVLPDPKLNEKIDVRPVMSIKSKINIVRKIQPGDSVGYDRLFKAVQNTQIANIPVGYGDGYSKMLTSKSECIIKKKKYPLVGSVCMDQCMVNIGDDAIEQGDDVIILGSDGENTITANELADKVGTIPYEILTMVSSRVPRVYV